MARSKSHEIKTIATNWANNTTFNGVPHVLNAPNKFKRLFWFLVVTTGVGEFVVIMKNDVSTQPYDACKSAATDCKCFWLTFEERQVITLVQIAFIISDYLKYPVQVSIDITDAKALEFPAVSFCNSNKIRKSKAHLLGDVFSTNDALGSDAERMDLRNEIDAVWAKQPNDTQQKLGHQKDLQVIDCTFNGKTCSHRNFTYVTNPQFGNCFTFNGRSIGTDVEKSHRTGALYGLTVELFLEEHEYMTDMTESAGFAVTLHHQDTMPYPEDHAVLASPGEKTNIAMYRMDIKRLKHPYPSNCLDLTIEEASAFSAYSEKYKVNYDLHGCHRSCFQAHVVSKCSCGDPKLPLGGQAVSMGKKLEPCGPEKETCVGDVKKQFIEGNLTCDCRPPCSETEYAKTVSSEKWPNEAFLKQYVEKVKRERPDLVDYMNENAGKKLLKISIFYTILNFEVIQEQPVYTFSGMMADLGGIMGLYLGLSVVALFEFGEMIVDVCRLLIFSKKSGDKNKGYQAPTEMS